MLAELATLANLEDAIAREFETVLLVVLLLGIATIFCVTSMVKRSSVTRQREQTKREVAAYIAEGSMTPEDAHKILAAGEGHHVRELVLQRAADGWISPKKADQILSAMDKSDPAKA